MARLRRHLVRLSGRRCAGSLAARRHVVRVLLQTLSAEAAYVWVCAREGRVVEECHALQMLATAGVEAAATTVLLGAL